ncbi:MAG: outer membrane beta-barrel protein, partial [Lentimicrobium sp.]|nr:outer membrane beta-barrel protein [Lentimicrobium sp.]
MRKVIILILLYFPVLLMAQTNLSGLVLDEVGRPMPYATVALLKPVDSTLVFFGITNDKGAFDIKKISRGAYIMQVAFIGFKTFYNNLKMPEQAGDYGIIVLPVKPLDLSSAEVVAGYIPVLVRKDTIEYNAGAFKIKPDAVAEDLLKKLPGIEVDRAGNIRAMGEDVKNVMVDGKEFFSSDPKVATKNLPADAISKVQVYDKKSESAELAGIEDNSREKTINLLLRDGKKQAWLGDVQAGAGTENHYMASAKVYRFTGHNQFAALGMLNNVNKFGFSFQDYIDFNGGLPAMVSGGSMKLSITSDSEIPVNFGQSINGLVSSGAGGVNYSFEPKKNNRLYASYLGSGSDRNLKQSIFTRNYTSSVDFIEESESVEESRNFTHRLNLGWKDKSDSTHTFLFNGNIGLVSAGEDVALLAKAFSSGNLVNKLESLASLNRNNLTGSGSFSYLQRGKNAFKLYNLSANAGFSSGLSKSDRLNISSFPGSEISLTELQYRDNEDSNQRYGLSGSALIMLGNGLYLEPELNANTNIGILNRHQGIPGDGETAIDSLSPFFEKMSFRLTPGLNLKKNYKKSKIVFGLSYVMAENVNILNDTSSYTSCYSRLLPSLSWEFDYKTGHRISLDYNSTVEEPQIAFLQPVVENSNPQSLFYGNRQLKPETSHFLSSSWLLFDQFSQTSVFARMGGTYTMDKVGYSMTINDSLMQIINLMNTKDDYSFDANIEFSTPLRFAGLNFHLTLDGRLNKGQTFINDVENINTNYSRSIRISFDNRKRDTWKFHRQSQV